MTRSPDRTRLGSEGQVMNQREAQRGIRSRIDTVTGVDGTVLPTNTLPWPCTRIPERALRAPLVVTRGFE
jgi:hypothetical protein